MTIGSRPDCQSRRDRGADHPRGAEPGTEDSAGAQRTPMPTRWPCKLADEAVDIGPPRGGEILPQHRGDPRGGQGGRRRRHPSGLWLPGRERRLRRSCRGGGADFRRAGRRRHPADGRQGRRRAQVAAQGRRADRARQRRARRRLAEARGDRRRDRLSRDDQGGGRRRRARHPHRPRRWRNSSACCRRRSAEAKAAFGDGGLYHREGDRAARHIEVQMLGDGRDVVHCFERECSLQRRRQKVWEEAPPPPLGPSVREALCDAAVALARVGRLPRRRHARISLRRRRRRLLFHRDEHPHPGRASGDRDDHRHRSRARDDPASPAASRCGFARTTSPLRGHAIEVPHQRRGPGARASCRSRARSTTCACPAAPGVRFDTHALCRLHGPAVLRFAARQADRLGRGPRRMRWRACSARSPSSRSPASRRRCRCIRRSPTTPTCAPARFHTGWLEDWLETQCAASPDVERGRRPDDRAAIPSAATSTSSSKSTRRCRWRRSSRACRSPTRCATAQITGVTEICPANASFQIKFDPDVISARRHAAPS